MSAKKIINEDVNLPGTDGIEEVITRTDAIHDDNIETDADANRSDETSDAGIIENAENEITKQGFVSAFPTRAPRGSRSRANKISIETDTNINITADADVTDGVETNAAPARSSTRPRTSARTGDRRVAAPSILTIESNAEVSTPQSVEETAWHEIRNAYRTRRILSGTLDGIERTETGKTICVAHFNDFRVVIPMKEMMINQDRSAPDQDNVEHSRRQNMILSNMIGAEIDFIVKGIETKSRSVVASRKEAMLRKRQTFYLETDSSGMCRVYEGRVVQARVIAVAEKVLRVEAFGVECAILARDLSWGWFGDAREHYSVGDQILIRIRGVERKSIEDISISADVKSVTGNTSHENVKKCRAQSKYAGRVTDVRNGVVFIHLANGANAVAHACYDRRMPGKKDDVSFVVTRVDEENSVALGIITRIIKQNL